MMENLRIMAYKPEEAFDMLGVGRNSGYRWIKEGKIPSVRLGRRILIPLEGLEKLLNGDKTQAL